MHTTQKSQQLKHALVQQHGVRALERQPTIARSAAGSALSVR